MKIKIVNINILFILDLKKKKMNYSQRVQKNQGRKIARRKEKRITTSVDLNRHKR